MPNKPIKACLKVWCCCCSCCGYLCTFQVYEGKPIDPVTGKSTSEKRMVTRVVKDLVDSFLDSNHAVYVDNYFTSGPLVKELAQDKIYVHGTIKQRAVGFPEGLKSVKLSKGNYACERVGDICYYVFKDRSGCVLLVMPSLKQWRPRLKVQLNRTSQFQSIPPLLPAYIKYMVV